MSNHSLWCLSLVAVPVTQLSTLSLAAPRVLQPISLFTCPQTPFIAPPSCWPSAGPSFVSWLPFSTGELKTGQTGSDEDSSVLSKGARSFPQPAGHTSNTSCPRLILSAVSTLIFVPTGAESCLGQSTVWESSSRQSSREPGSSAQARSFGITGLQLSCCKISCHEGTCSRFQWTSLMALNTHEREVPTGCRHFHFCSAAWLCCQTPLSPLPSQLTRGAGEEHTPQGLPDKEAAA